MAHQLEIMFTAFEHDEFINTLNLGTLLLFLLLDTTTITAEKAEVIAKYFKRAKCMNILMIGMSYI